MKVQPLFFPISLALLAAATAGPSRKVGYEPPIPGEAAQSRPNLLAGANATASGHWDKQTPDLAINGNRSVADHWACENLPAWHQVELSEVKPSQPSACGLTGEMAASINTRSRARKMATPGSC